MTCPRCKLRPKDPDHDFCEPCVREVTEPADMPNWQVGKGGGYDMSVAKNPYGMAIYRMKRPTRSRQRLPEEIEPSWYNAVRLLEQ